MAVIRSWECETFCLIVRTGAVTPQTLKWQEKSISVTFWMEDNSLLMAALKCCFWNVLFVRAGPVTRSPVPAPSLSPEVTRGSVSISFLHSEWKISFLYWLLWSAAAAGELVHGPSGLHLTNLQSKPCKSIQLEMNGNRSICQLETGLPPAESQGSSTDREGLETDRGGHWGTERYLLLPSFPVWLKIELKKK